MRITKALVAIVGVLVPSTLASAAPITLPTVNVTSLSHTDDTWYWGTTAFRRSRDTADAAAATITTSLHDHDGVVATLRAPDGYKFVVTPASTATHTTKVGFDMFWGTFVAATPATLDDHALEFHDLTGVAPTRDGRQTFVDPFGTRIRIMETFDVASSFEFTGLTASFRYNSSQMAVRTDRYDLRTTSVLWSEANSMNSNLDVTTMRLIAIVPEPASFAVMGFGAALLMARRRRVTFPATAPRRCRP